MNPISTMSSLPAAGVPFPRVCSALSRFGRAIWRGLEARGQARARRELRGIIERCETTQPELARQLREADAFIAGQ